MKFICQYTVAKSSSLVVAKENLYINRQFRNKWMQFIPRSVSEMRMTWNKIVSNWRIDYNSYQKKHQNSVTPSEELKYSWVSKNSQTVHYIGNYLTIVSEPELLIYGLFLRFYMHSETKLVMRKSTVFAELSERWASCVSYDFDFHEFLSQF